MSSHIKIFAHRGGPARAPENSMRAFMQCIKDGASGFECDVCLTKDREPVILHKEITHDTIFDATLKNISLSSLTFKDLSAFKIKNSDEPIPHLDDVLDFVESQPQCECFLEPKQASKELIEIIVQKIKKRNLLNRSALITFFARKNMLAYARALSPHIRICPIFVPIATLFSEALCFKHAGKQQFLPKKDTQAQGNRIAIKPLLISPTFNFARAAHALGAQECTIALPRTARRKSLPIFSPLFLQRIKALKKHGIRVNAGLVENEQDVSWLLRHGIHEMWSDNVPRIADSLKLQGTA